MDTLDFFSKYGPVLGDLGKVAGGVAAGRAAGRTTEADLNLRSGIAQQDANVQASDATARRRAEALANALRGRMLQGTKDATVSGLPYGVNPPTITGGARPSNIVGAEDLGKTLAAQGDAGLNAPPVQAENFDNLAPTPNVIDKISGFAGTTLPILDILGKVGKVAGAGGGAAAGGAGAGGGSAVGGLLTNPITLGAGAALAIGLAIKHHQNATKGDRNKFAKDAGFKDIAAFNEYLSTLGPAGQAAREYGENVVGKHNKQQEAQWLAMVQQAVNASGKPLTMGQTPNPFSFGRG